MSDCVVVTGHCGGLGRALVKTFTERGYQVIGIGRDVDDQLSIPQIEIDLNCLTSHQQIEAVKAAVTEHVGSHRLIGLINNAAIQILGPVLDLKTEDLTESFTTNVIAPLVLVQMLHPLLEKTHGTVVNIGSIHASLTKPGFGPYSISKAAMAGLTRAMALELGKSIRIIEIQPAAIATPMLEAGFEGDPAGRQLLNDYHPTGTIGEPDEVSELICRMVETDTAFLNGSVVTIDGGISYRLHDPS